MVSNWQLYVILLFSCVSPHEEKSRDAKEAADQP
jgi:hypothetical protein